MDCAWDIGRHVTGQFGFVVVWGRVLVDIRQCCDGANRFGAGCALVGLAIATTASKLATTWNRCCMRGRADGLGGKTEIGCRRITCDRCADGVVGFG